MNIAGRYKEKQMVAGFNLDLVTTFTVDEKTKAVTVHFLGGEKVEFKDKEAENIYAILAKYVLHSITAAQIVDWRKQLKQDQEKAQKDATKKVVENSKNPAARAAVL